MTADLENPHSHGGRDVGPNPAGTAGWVARENTYLKQVQAPVGVKAVLKCWMEVN